MSQSHRIVGIVVGAVVALLLLIPMPETEALQREDGPPVAQHLEAERELLRQAMLEARVATDRPRPGINLWARDAGVALSQLMAGWVGRVLPGFARWWAPFFEPLLMVLLALLAALLLTFLVRFGLERWRRSRAVIPAPVRHLGATADAAAARDWEGELRRRLGNDEVTAAVEALWWWLATGLVADRAEPSWTSRELVIRAGRRDLLAAVRRLDRMMYGVTRPSTDEVSRLWGDLREAMG